MTFKGPAYQRNLPPVHECMHPSLLSRTIHEALHTCIASTTEQMVKTDYQTDQASRAAISSSCRGFGFSTAHHCGTSIHTLMYQAIRPQIPKVFFEILMRHQQGTHNASGTTRQQEPTCFNLSTRGLASESQGVCPFQGRSTTPELRKPHVQPYP